MSSLSLTSHTAPHGPAPIRTYWLVYAGLLALTVATYAVSFVDLGPLSLPIAILVACAKATLVVLFFMHLLHDERFNGLVFVASVFFMVLFFGFTMIDVVSRGWVTPVETAQYWQDSQDAQARMEAAGAGPRMPTPQGTESTAVPLHQLPPPPPPPMPVVGGSGDGSGDAMGVSPVPAVPAPIEPTAPN